MGKFWLVMLFWVCCSSNVEEDNISMCSCVIKCILVFFFCNVNVFWYYFCVLVVSLICYYWNIKLYCEVLEIVVDMSLLYICLFYLLWVIYCNIFFDFVFLFNLVLVMSWSLCFDGFFFFFVVWWVVVDLMFCFL